MECEDEWSTVKPLWKPWFVRQATMTLRKLSWSRLNSPQPHSPSTQSLCKPAQNIILVIVHGRKNVLGNVSLSQRQFYLLWGIAVWQIYNPSQSPTQVMQMPQVVATQWSISAKHIWGASNVFQWNTPTWNVVFHGVTLSVPASPRKLLRMRFSSKLKAMKTLRCHLPEPRNDGEEQLGEGPVQTWECASLWMGMHWTKPALGTSQQRWLTLG